MQRTANRPMRTTLAERHIAAVAIAVLLIWSVQSFCQALWPPLSRVLEFVFTGIAILGIPYFDAPLNVRDRTTLTFMLIGLVYSIITLAAANLLSHYVYGRGPILALSAYGKMILRRNHA